MVDLQRWLGVGLVQETERTVEIGAQIGESANTCPNQESKRVTWLLSLVMKD